MGNKKLIREFFALCPDGICDISALTESEKREVREEGAMYLTGILQRADAKNGNGRVYPRAILEREIANYKKLVAENRALGECDHPDDSVINLKNASHLVTDIWWDGNEVWGKMKILSTPSGNILKELIKSGVKLGTSSRGLGSVSESMGRTMVEDDFQLICFDMVSEPSTHGAFMGLTESKKSPNIFTKADKLNRIMNDILNEHDDLLRRL